MNELQAKDVGNREVEKNVFKVPASVAPGGALGGVNDIIGSESTSVGSAVARLTRQNRVTCV